MGICTNRTIIVTGSGSGLGRQYALALAAESANVVVNDINRAGAESVVDEIVKAGGKAVASVDDITSMRGAQAIVDAGVNAFGDVHEDRKSVVEGKSVSVRVDLGARRIRHERKSYITKGIHQW